MYSATTLQACKRAFGPNAQKGDKKVFIGLFPNEVLESQIYLNTQFNYHALPDVTSSLFITI